MVNQSLSGPYIYVVRNRQISVLGKRKANDFQSRNGRGNI